MTADVKPAAPHPAPHPARLALLVGVAVAVAAVIWSLGPLPQEEEYHRFADSRSWLGIPNFLDVVSNLPFAVVGIGGLVTVFGGQRPAFLERFERWPFAAFFGGVLLTAFGSAWYHLEPTTLSLVWDRLPLAVVFAAFSVAMIGERLGAQRARPLLVPLIVLAIAGVVHWHLGELKGGGDLRLYGMTQFVPIAAIPLMLVLFPARYTRTADLALGAGAYVLAKLLEYLDREVFEVLGGILSGHTLKHVAGAGATAVIWMHLRKREPLVNGAEAGART